MSIKCNIIIFLTVLFTFCALQGQNEGAFRQLSKKEGLSQASVFAIAQDSSGFIWFGTRDGLNKYDGYQFYVYRSDTLTNSIASNDIRILFTDRKDKTLWVGTNSGLSKYRSGTDDFTTFRYTESDSTSISCDIIRCLFRDSKNRLWIGTGDGLNLFENNKFGRFFFTERNPSSLSGNDIKAITEDQSGNLWFGTTDGLYVLRATNSSDYQFERIDPQLNLSDTHIKCLLEDSKNNLWIGTNMGGVNYWNRSTGTITTYLPNKSDPNSLSHMTTRSMVLDKKGRLWVGTFEGLNLFKEKENKFVRFGKNDLNFGGLSDESIHSCFRDKRGSLWFGTYYGGVNHFDENNNQFTNFIYAPYGKGLSSDIVSSFAEDEKGNLWVGTEGGGLNYYDRYSQKFSNYKFASDQKEGISGNNVKQLLLDKEGLWIGVFEGGLNYFDLKNKKFTHFKNIENDPNSLSNNNVYGLLREGDKLWILTYGGGLNILELGSQEFRHYTHEPDDGTSISSNLARVVLKTNDRTIWIGTEGGVNKVLLDEEGFPKSFQSFLSDKKIYSLQEDYQHQLWIGTISDGLFRLDPQSGHLDHFTEKDGLPGNTIFGILEDSNRQLWLSTSNGLSKFDPEKKTFSNFNYSNGLENSEYNFNAYYKTKQGDFLFGGMHGFTLFSPNNIQPNTFVPPVVFTNLKQNNKVVKIGDEAQPLTHALNETDKITFKYNEANFSIGFAALDFFSPENNRYAYLLEGLDQGWTYTTGDNEATYTIQRAGSYTFRLKGANSDGVWNPNERRLEIVVLPPPWRSWLAYLIYLTILGMLIFGVVRFFRLRHSVQLQKIEKQKQEELHEVKLRFFTNITHEFRTPLTLIMGPLKELIEKKEYPEKFGETLSQMDRNAQRLLNLVNQVLTFRKLATDHEPMQIGKENIVHFLEEIFLPFRETAHLRKIDYQFDAASKEILAWYDSDKLERVFFNLLANAFKFTPDEGSIKMSIVENDENIVITVEDSGKGIPEALHHQIFKRFYEKANSERSTIKGSGIGLAISRQMVELHQGDISVGTSVQKGGAIFTVEIPKGHEHFKDEEILNELTQVETMRHYAPILSKIDSSPIIDDLSANKALDKDLPLVLIVEDNPEIRNYIVRIFSKEYRLITAKTGVEGLRKTKKEHPQLIISDVMMPEMDGITFCGKLKTDIEISHIPVILLTARTASLFKIEGLEIGADDYITKPFNPEELRLRVRNIIRARQKAKEKFARTLNFDPKEIKITSADETFLENAMQIAEDNIENYEFNVQTFADQLAVSRPLLFTKLKELTGQTPNNFMKTIRLKRAAQLLKTQKLNVSEVAYKVGFKDPKYFRKCFKAHFHVSPSEF